MSIDDFGRYSKVLHGLTVDFVRAVPEDKWDFTPRPARAVWPRTSTASDRRRLRAVLQATPARRVCARCLQCRAGNEKSGLDAKARSLCRSADSQGAPRRA